MLIYPRYLPIDYNIPPTLYSLMESIVNFDREEKVKIKDLPSYAREEIFDFTYPLSTHVTKNDFEELILKHFLMRRIGYDTLTAFKIALDVKLNEIMPTYNLMFDALDGWNLLGSEEEVRQVNDSRATQSSNTNTTTQNMSNTSDRRYSELPNNQLTNVQDGTYVTDYNYDTNTQNATSNDTNTGLINDSGNLREVKTKDATSLQKVEIYSKFLEKRQHIYTMIFKELDTLFYGLC